MFVPCILRVHNIYNLRNNSKRERNLPFLSEWVVPESLKTNVLHEYLSKRVRRYDAKRPQARTVETIENLSLKMYVIDSLF